MRKSFWNNKFYETHFEILIWNNDFMLYICITRGFNTKCNKVRKKRVLKLQKLCLSIHKHA